VCSRGSGDPHLDIADHVGLADRQLRDRQVRAWSVRPVVPPSGRRTGATPGRASPRCRSGGRRVHVGEAPDTEHQRDHTTDHADPRHDPAVGDVWLLAADAEQPAHQREHGQRQHGIPGIRQETHQQRRQPVRCPRSIRRTPTRPPRAGSGSKVDRPYGAWVEGDARGMASLTSGETGWGPTGYRVIRVDVAYGYRQSQGSPE